MLKFVIKYIIISLNIVCGIRDDPPETHISSEVGTTATEIEHCLDEEKVVHLKGIFADLLLNMPTLTNRGISGLQKCMHVIVLIYTLIKSNN